MTDAIKQTVLDALAALPAPGTGKDVVSAGWVSGFFLRGGKLGFAIELPKGHGMDANLAEQLSEGAKELAQKAAKDYTITVVLTGEPPAPAAPQRPAPPKPKALDGIRHIIAVVSGKGGVGKSTVAVNLAVALAQSGAKVGIVDADIYGPSLPKMLGLSGKPEIEHNRMIPPMAHGISCLSIGLLLDEDSPAAWRGPMVAKALSQLFREADWGTLDYLVVDMPPGTGDVHLSIAQNFTLSGAVVVTTPQEVALLDTRKAAALLEKLNIPVLGVVENMSYFVDAAGNHTAIFGEGGGETLAALTGAPLLAKLPLYADVVKLADTGTPVAALPQHEAAKLFKKIAESIAKKLA